MNFTSLLDVLNVTQKRINNGSTVEEITPREEEEENQDGWFHLYIQGKVYMTCILIVTSLGVAGNIMSFILMLDAKLNSFAYSVYMKWLAVSDSLLLIMVSTEDTLDTYDNLNSFLTVHVVFCRVWGFFKSVTFTLSPWLVVTLTLDRFVCIVFPLSRHVLCTRSKATKLCLTLTLATLALNIQYLIFPYINDNECILPDIPTLINYGIFMNLVLKSTLPCALVLVLNIITISRIRRSLSFRRQFARDNISKAEKEGEDKSTLPLLLVSVLAFVTLLPRTVTEAVELFLEFLQPDDIALILASNVWPIFNVIYLMNFAQNFYILIASWPEYRMIIQKQIGLFKANGKSSSQQKNPSQSSSTQFSETCVSDVPTSVSMTSHNITPRSPSGHDAE